MIVRLTYWQRQKILRMMLPRVKPPLLGNEPIAEGTKSSYDCDLPAAAWKYIFREIQDRVIGPRGGYNRQMGALINAGQRIAKALVEVKAHPALRGVAMPEPSTFVIPVWITEDRYWSIYPVEGSEMLVLWPTPVEWGGMTVTEWQPTIPVELAHEEEIAWFFVDLGRPAEDAREVVG